MALSNEQALPITGFKGLNKARPTPGDGYTRSLKNVHVRDLRVQGRGGVKFNSSFSAATAENTLGLMAYVSRTDLSTTLLRIGRTKVYKATSATGTWSDITGTALTAAADFVPQWADFRGYVYFVNEGNDYPRYWSGSSNTVDLSSVSAPKAKGVMSYYGFLFLLNIYDSSASAFAPRRAQYSQTPDSDWTLCAGNIRNFDETPGGIVCGIPFSESAAIIKEDGVVILRWVGGNVVFKQKLVKGALGSIAPLSAQAVGEGESGTGVVYLATNYTLQLVDDNGAKPLPPNVNMILQNDLYKSSVANCRSTVLRDRNLYVLFFPLDSNGNTGRIDWNYITGEFTYHTYGTNHAVTAVQNVRWSKTAAETPVIAHNTKTYHIDDDTQKYDYSATSTYSTVSRYYDTDWMSYANANEGRVVQSAAQFTGATLIFQANNYMKCAVSVAFNHQNNYRFRKMYDLRPKKGNSTADEYVEVRYDLPPMDVEWVSLRIEFLPNSSGNPILRSGALHFVPQDTHQDVRRSATSNSMGPSNA